MWAMHQIKQTWVFTLYIAQNINIILEEGFSELSKTFENAFNHDTN